MAIIIQRDHPFSDAVEVAHDDLDPTKKIIYELSAISPGTTRTVTWPDSDVTIGSSGAHAASHTDGSDDIQDATAAQKGVATAAQITKLDAIEASATADQSDAEIKTAYENNADTNEFSDAEQTKLLGVEASATADQSDAEIKTAYENNADTNEFSDAEQTKLGGIAPLANVGITASSTDTLTNKTINDESNDVHADHIHIHVRNESGGAITMGQPVYASGYNIGQLHTTVDLADATAAATMPCIGVCGVTSAANNSNFMIIENGSVSGLDTSSFAVGDCIYVSETAGAITNVPPTGTALVQRIASVLRSHASLGVISVFLQPIAVVTGFAATLLDDGTQAAAKTTLGLTDSEIKTAYENNADTNEFSDAEQTKLLGVEASATADQSDGEIETAYNSQVAVVAQVDAEAGTSTVRKGWTPERVKQAIDALGGGGGGDVVDDLTPQLGGVLDTNAKAIDESEATPVASATSTDIWATDGNTVHVTGTTTITGFATAPRVGAYRKVIFDGALTLTDGANLNLPSSANITTAADDYAVVYAETTTLFKVVVYSKADGTAVVGSGASGMNDLLDDLTPQLGGVLDTNDKAINESEGAPVASAAAPNIWSTTGNTIHITGAAAITSFPAAPRVGLWRKLVFDGSLVFTNSAALVLPGGANITTAAGDIAFVYADSLTLFRVAYFKADGKAIAHSLLDDTSPQLGGVLDTNSFVINESEGASVASVAAPNIWVTDGNTIHITGTAAITSFPAAPSAGVWRKLIFDDALVFTNSGALILPGGASITTAAGDIAFVYADTTTLFRVAYFKADGKAIAHSLLDDTSPQLGGVLETNSFVINESEATPVASVAAPNIWATDGNTLHVTGTNAITSFPAAPSAGVWRKLVFDDVLVFTNSAALVLPGAGNITTAAGDIAFVYADTTTLFRVVYFPADGTAVVGGGGGGLTEWTEAGTATTSVFTALQAGADIDAILKAKGTGAVRADTAGNARGADAVDWQSKRAIDTQVASGAQSTIGGGEDSIASGIHSTVGGGDTNTASGTHSTVGGGQGSTASGTYANVPGGVNNNATATSATVGGGDNNLASALEATIAGGRNNNASAANATTGGGINNDATGISSTVSGGTTNVASGLEATVAGGDTNTASSSNATVSGGLLNTAGTGIVPTVSGGTTNAATGNYSTIGGGANGICSGISATIAGGQDSTASGDYSTVVGGASITATASFATAGGGHNNDATASYATVGGGQLNVASGLEATVSGGDSNTADSSNATVSGGVGNTAGTGLSPTVSGGATNAATGNYSTIGGGANGICSGESATIAGGQDSTASGNYSTVGGGASVTATAANATSGGGINNDATGISSTVSGGDTNVASGLSSTIGGGDTNTTTSAYTTVGGGLKNDSTSTSATVGGGDTNIASGQNSTIAGGVSNTATNDATAVSGGNNNAATGAHSSIPGGRHAVADKYGQFAHASGSFSADGDCQRSDLQYRNQTTNNTITELFLDGSSLRGTIPSGKTYTFSGHATVRQISGSAGTAGDSAGIKFEGVIKNVGGTTSLEAAATVVEISSAAALTVVLSVTADNTNDSLKVELTGETNKNLSVGAFVDLFEIA